MANTRREMRRAQMSMSRALKGKTPAMAGTSFDNHRACQKAERQNHNAMCCNSNKHEATANHNISRKQHVCRAHTGC